MRKVSALSDPLYDMPQMDAASFLPVDRMALFNPKRSDHAPRILLLYGSVRARSFSRLVTQEAARIARAAEACANAGSLDEAITISMEIEQILYEAGRLQDAASLLNRISKA